MAKCHHTVFGILRPNSIPTENSGDQIIQLTSVAFGLDWRLPWMWWSSLLRDKALPIPIKFCNFLLQSLF